MSVDDPCDGDAADDRVLEHDRFVPAESAETRDREECYRDLRAHDQAPERQPGGGRADEARFGGDRGWRWKGLELGPEANRVADEGLAVRQSAEGRDAEGRYGEGGLSPAMRRVEAELTHGTLVPDTEKFALKSADRFKEKLAKMIERYPGQPCGELVSAIHDGIRYTFLFPTGNYTAGVADAIQALSDRGYDLRIRKPSWHDGDYRALTPDGPIQKAGSCSRCSFTHQKAGRPSRRHTTSMRSCVIPGLRHENANS